jgi:hypothetical protein
MNSTIQQRVLLATMACLRPLARVLLRTGINYRQFAEIAKDAFLEEALAERDGRGRGANVSRIAVRTGLSRKEVARIKARRASVEAAAVEAFSALQSSGHAARALQLWHVDPRYVSGDGTPRDLLFSGEEVSFTSLVRQVGGDIPAGAVRAELMAARAVVELSSGHLRPVKRYFVPGDVDEELVVGLTHIVHPVMEGLARNTGPLKNDPFVQRLAYSDRLIPAAVPLFRQIARVQCADFVQSIDDWLSSNEIGSDVQTKNPTRVGVGVFYFEGNPPSDHSPPRAQSPD